MLTERGLRSVQVGRFRVADASRDDVVAAIVHMYFRPDNRPRTAYALHVGGLNGSGNSRFTAAMNQADIVYADGGAVVILARLAGAYRIERAPTTDIGWDVLRGLSRRLGRPARFALIGGPEGLASRAAHTLAGGGFGVPVAVEHGYHTDWSEPLARVRGSGADIVFVGLGAPREMTWVQERLAELPAVPVVTCGGWFGFLAGVEHRAPTALRRPGLEWIARAWQDPRRLGPRYAKGCFVTAGMVPAALGIRMRRGALS